MEAGFKDKFIALWKKFFPGCPLPVTFYYSDNIDGVEPLKPVKGHHCFIAEIERVRKGENLCFNNLSFGCPGGRYYLGYSQKLRPDFDYFLSCGIPGKLEGERYKKTPEIVHGYLDNNPPFNAPGKFVFFKRWDMLDEADMPAVVVFYATPDILSGIFTLATYDTAEMAVIAPMGSGCASIVAHPYRESLKENPRAVLGMFDVTARPHVPENAVTFAVPYDKFTSMVENMEESFLSTSSWDALLKRVEKQGKSLQV